MDADDTLNTHISLYKQLLVNRVKSAHTVPNNAGYSQGGATYATEWGHMMNMNNIGSN